MARVLAEPATKQPMFAEASKRAVWRDRGEPGGEVGVAGAAKLSTRKRRGIGPLSLYRK